jgi:hypothetical protein
MNEGQITDRANARRYVTETATRSHFTLVSTDTGARYTYRVRNGRLLGIVFIDLLVGADNKSDYEFIGSIRRGVYRHSAKSVIRADAPSAVAIDWFMIIVSRDGPIPSGVEFWHEGKCSRCGRMLTDPKSIAAGMGPVCREKAALLEEHCHG